MFSDIRRILSHSPTALLGDAAGCMAIVVTLMAALHLPEAF